MKVIILFLCTISLFASEFTSEIVDIDKSSGYIVYKKGTKEKVTGFLKTYYDDNKTVKELIPLKNGEISGVYKSYYKSNKLSTKIDYKDSKRDGKHIGYFESGSISYESDMKNEKREGHVKVWYENSQLRFDALFEDDNPEGIVTTYLEDGTIESIEEYKNGRVINQIQAKKPDNIQLQTRALTTYGEGKDIYYLFISPVCPSCKDFLSNIDKFKKDVTFYVYLVPLSDRNKKERKLLDIVYSKKYAKERMDTIFDIKNDKVNLSQFISAEDTSMNNTEILKAQRMQATMRVRSVPTLIDTNGYLLRVDELYKKYSISK